MITTAEYPSTVDLLTAYGDITFAEPMAIEAFLRLAEQVPDLKMERTPAGKVTVMAPVKSASSENEGHFFGYVYAWNLQRGKPGRVYSPSGGFILNGQQMRCSDTTWVSNGRLASFLANPDHRTEFVNVAPDFVVEVKSDSDRIPKLHRKMREVWMAAGVRLAWLVDTEEERVYIYRAGQSEPEVVTDFEKSELDGEDVLPEFVFPLVELNL